MSVVSIANYLAESDRQVDGAGFKNAMRRLAGAVSVVTVGTGTVRTGFTATSVTSFSVDPPTVLITVNRESSSWPALLEAGCFGVNILSEYQSDIADRFAGRGDIKGNDRYVGWDWKPLPSGSLGLSGALAILDCDLEEAIERHSHAILLGRVRAAETNADLRPLLYWSQAYQHIGGTSDPVIVSKDR